jgi:hypothetical protein
MRLVLSPQERSSNCLASPRGSNTSRVGDRGMWPPVHPQPEQLPIGEGVPAELLRPRLGEPHHHAYVVDDIEATVSRLVDQLGAGPFFLIEGVPLENVLSRGEAAEFVQQLRLWLLRRWRDRADGSPQPGARARREGLLRSPAGNPPRRLRRAAHGGSRFTTLARRARSDGIPELSARRSRNNSSRRLRRPGPRRRVPRRQRGPTRLLRAGEGAPRDGTAPLRPVES